MGGVQKTILDTIKSITPLLGKIIVIVNNDGTCEMEEGKVMQALFTLNLNRVPQFINPKASDCCDFY